jgi:hypothetical protein
MIPDYLKSGEGTIKGPFFDNNATVATNVDLFALSQTLQYSIHGLQNGK